MRVGVDARHLAGRRGVAHYTAALLGELACANPGDEWLLFVPGRGPLAIDAGPDPELGARLLAAPNVTVRRHRLPGRALFGTAAVAGRPRLDRLLGGGLDVLWAPAPAPLALSAGVPFVLTVHDLSFLDRPDDFTAYERLWHRLARPGELVARATRVIAVSGTVRRALLERYRLDEARVAVVRSGIDAGPAGGLGGREDPAAVARRLGVGGDYLLCVGALEPRKAPELLVAAHARAREQGLSCELAFAGAGRLQSRLTGEGVHVLGHVAPRELDALYTGALAVVTPSWLEGFGLPPLEGLARGTPAVVSDLPVYQETLGDGALRFAPGDEHALAAALLRIAADEPLRVRLVAAGRAAAAVLTWAQAARATREVLSEAAA